MKKMMTNMKTLVALLMAGAAVTSCSSDNEMDSLKAPAGKTYTMTVQATKGGDATTRALELGADGKTLTATWATTENVYVKKGDAWATGSLKPQTAGASTTLKGTLSGVTFAVDDVLTLQFPKSGDITYAGQKGTLADIAANFDWAVAGNVWVTSVDGDGNIDTGENVMEFDHQQAIVRFTLKNSDGTALPSNPTAFTMTDGTSTVELTSIPAGTYTTNGAGVLYVAFPASNGSADITLTATVGTDTYTCTASNKTFYTGNFYRVTAKMAKQASVPENALSGQFTVGMDGSTPRKVYFSKGNLQAKIANYNSTTKVATASEWKFADSQYSYIGNAAGNTTFATDTWVDLFSWVGNSATNDTYGLITFTSSSQANHGNVSGESLKTDWGSRMGTGWFTLSSAEWTYLFNTRTVNGGTGSGKSYTLGQNVNNVLGVVLYPDDYTGAEYSGSDWSTFEAAGCVFLPAAGCRSGTSVRVVGSSGYYWSRTANSTGIAFRVDFGSGGVNPAGYNGRQFGFSVRLVRPVQP